MSQVALTDSKAARKIGADSFAKSVLLIGCLMILQRGIGFLRSFYVCGVLTPAEVGQWDLAFSFLMLVAPLAVLGIPGSFGRYIAYYENQNQHNRLLRHSLFACLALVLLVAGMIYTNRTVVARLFFGDESQVEVVGFLAFGLPLIVLFNFATCWFTGQRLNRFVFRIQFAQTAFFAVLCVFVFQAFAASAVSVIVAYLVSCSIGLLLASSYLYSTSVSSREEAVSVQKANKIETLSIWKKILPFAIWVWVSNALINLFTVCDRLLLVNFYPVGGGDVQALIGQYHTSRIIPLLLVAVGAMAGSTVTPYISNDWESGNREGVANRLNLMIKAIGVGCISFAVLVLLIAPVLFDGIWNNKFSMGESLLPLTLCYCSLAATTLVAQKYFWCLEKTWYSSSILAVGLVVNFLLGLTFIEPFGVEGVVVSTLLSHMVVLVGVLALCQRRGMQFDRGVLIVIGTLFVICLGKWVACLGLSGLLFMVVCRQWIFDKSEKRIALNYLRSFRSKITGFDS